MNASLRALFLRLAADEDLHFEILKSILHQEEGWSV